MAIHRVLIVEDDAEMARMMADFLRAHGYFVQPVGNRAEARAAMAAGRIDLILLDIGLGAESGLEICAEIRATQEVPIIIVSALSADDQRMAGYRVGADDYIAKPFNPDLLLARIRAVLRRAGRAPSLGHRRRGGMWRFGDWRYDGAQDSLIAPEGFQVALSAREAALLRVFLARPQTVLTREEIAAALEDDDAASGRAIDMLVGRLRARCEAGLIRTERGQGYLFTAAVTDGVTDGETDRGADGQN